ncbi:DMT family transporter [Aestuariicoccus sp. MJ-SS9]|uniref:DMT family transporter n=1 Tax=Aestuariicoccus sp. MJ-SS9 TaxID=3079855 RepID=UPI00290839DD|nr:DMT family transporter [Aestuariicoccus sp. MJ-SS9]MDU8913651.1 DMT family transporter [Aestuariicoccus sp. MJ-SS9]
MTLTDNTRGALLMMATMAAFSLGDACVKATGGAMPLSQLLVVRGVFATTFIALMAWRLGALRLNLPRRDWALIALRSGAEVGAAYFFLTALFHMPIANVTALLQMLPLTVTLGGALFFGEPVGWRRWLAIAAGFLGMLLIVRPGTEGFTLYSVYALIAVVCVTVRDLTTRRMSAAVPSLTVTFAASLAVLVFAAVWSFGQDWVPVTPRLGWLLLGASIFIIGGYTFSVLVMRVGEVGFVAPFRYTGLLWALMLGLVFFGEWPAVPTLIGAAIIVATGVFTLWREARLRRRKAVPIAPR